MCDRSSGPDLVFDAGSFRSGLGLGVRFAMSGLSLAHSQVAIVVLLASECVYAQMRNISGK
jgi:hypothetical protein